MTGALEEIMKFNLNNLRLGFMNIHGQSGLTEAKQAQIESFILQHKLDILNLQEINIDSESFKNCSLISSSYNIIPNNAISKYGTASIVRSELIPENITFDFEGRIIVFNNGHLTVGNVYFPWSHQIKKRKLFL